VFVRPAHKAIVLNVRDVQRITTLIPGAKPIQHKGRTLVAVRHGIDEVKVLRNIGIDAPGPMPYYYQWPGGRVPFDAQRDTASFLTMHNRAFCLNDLGTGKTFAALAAFDYLRSQGRAKSMLVVSPLSTLERTWADEIFTYFPQYTTAVLHGSKDRRLKLLQEPFDIYVINHHGLKVVADELAAHPDIDVVVVDEIAVFRNSGSQLWKALKRVVDAKRAGHGLRTVWGLTGTPIPNDPSDAWAQCRLLCPENVPKYFAQFRDMVMRQAGPFRWVARDDALQVVERAMQPAIRFTRDQCIDLPPVIHTTRTVELEPLQKKLYVDMLKHLHAEAAAGAITAVNEGVKLSKLLQIACGVAYGDNRTLVPIAADSRVEVVREIIDESPAKVIVFVPFTSVLDMVAGKLQAHYAVECIHGGVSKSERDRIFKEFQSDYGARVLVAQPAAMSHGLTLTAASTIVWYGPVTSHETFEQANGRITRPGQKHNQLIVTIEGCDAERRMYQRLIHKKKTQGALLDMIKSVAPKEVLT